MGAVAKIFIAANYQQREGNDIFDNMWDLAWIAIQTCLVQAET